MTISINTIDDKVIALEGTDKTTPIAMSELDSRISDLNNRGKFKIRQLICDGLGATIPSEFLDYNWHAMEIQVRYKNSKDNSDSTLTFLNNECNLEYRNNNSKFFFNLIKEGNQIKLKSSNSMTNEMYAELRHLKVLFYTGTGE